MGIDTGTCMTGRLGSPGYSVVGSATDLADRLEGLTEYFGAHVIVSEAVVNTARDGFLVRRLGRVRYAGKDDAVRLFELVAEKDDSDAKLAEAMVTFGFSKSKANLEKSMPYFAWLCRRARKVRIMGSAGLGLTYVACVRFDAYAERKVRLWDIAAGALIVACAGGRFWCEQVGGFEAYRMVASNGLIDDQLPRPK